MSTLPSLTPPQPSPSPPPSPPPLPSVSSPSPSPSSPTPFDSDSPPPPGLSSLYPPSYSPVRYGEFPTAGRSPHSLATPLTESCAFKAATAVVVGVGFGVVWGVFSTSMGSGVNGVGVVPGGVGWVDPSTLTTREALRLTWRDMRRASVSSARSFGAIGGVYQGVECGVEKVRGRHDLTNALIAGCLTGGGFAARGGPQTAAAGCAGFAAFSYAIDRFLMGG